MPPNTWARRPGFEACETAVLTHGGMGYAKEFHVERCLRESLIARIAPVSRELILCNIAEKALGTAEVVLTARISFLNARCTQIFALPAPIA